MCALLSAKQVGRGCLFVALFNLPLSSVLRRFNRVINNYPIHHLKRLYGSLFARYLVAWCFPCAWSGDRTSVVVTTVVVTPTQSCVQLPGLLSSASFDDGNQFNHGLVKVWSVSAVKKQSSVLMVGDALQVVTSVPAGTVVPGLLKAPNCPALSTIHQATSPALARFHSQGAVGQLAT